MIYINSTEFKRTSKKDQDKFKQFQDEFSAHIDPNSGRIISPIILKYAPFKITPDRDNPGKMLMPRSLKLNFITRVPIDGQMAEVRYTQRMPIPNKDGGLKFIDNGTPVVDGQLAITDIDLAYYLWEFSDQNWGKEINKANPSAYFVIENLNYERSLLATAKREQAVINARLWNKVSDGGLTDSAIRTIAQDFMIPNAADFKDINELKLILEKLVKASQQNTDIFLTKSDRRELPSEEKAARRGMIADAIEGNIITQDLIKRQFFLVGMDGIPETEPLMTYKAADKDPKSTLYVFLEDTNPALFVSLKTRLEMTAATAE